MPDREADEVRGDGEGRIRRGGVRHGDGHLDEALDAAQALGQRPDLRPRDELVGLLRARGEEGDHAAEVPHLARGDLVAWVAGEAGVEDLLHGRVLRQEGRDRARVLAVAVHADCQRPHPAEHEPAVERARDGAEGLLQELQALGHGRVVGRGEAADHVGVAAQVLRRRVDDDVGPELERELEVGRGERVVDDDQGAGGVRRLGRLADVDDVEERVRRRLEPDDAGALVQVRLEAGLDLLARRGR